MWTETTLQKAADWPMKFHIQRDTLTYRHFQILARTRGCWLIHLSLKLCTSLCITLHDKDVHLNFKMDLQPSDMPKSCSAFSVLGLQEASSSTSVQQQDRISSCPRLCSSRASCSALLPTGLPADPAAASAAGSDWPPEVPRVQGSLPPCSWGEHRWP